MAERDSQMDTTRMLNTVSLTGWNVQPTGLKYSTGQYYKNNNGKNICNLKSEK